MVRCDDYDHGPRPRCLRQQPDFLLIGFQFLARRGTKSGVIAHQQNGLSWIWRHLILSYFLAWIVSGAWLEGRPAGLNEHAPDFFGEFFDAKGFGDVRKLMAVQEFVRVRGDDIAGDEEKAATERISGSHKRLVKMFAVEFGHFHVADDKVVVLFGRAFEGFATIEERLDAQAFVFEHIADEPRDGRLVFDDEHACPSP